MIMSHVTLKLITILTLSALFPSQNCKYCLVSERKKRVLKNKYICSEALEQEMADWRRVSAMPPWLV